jgi:hypothetical protein
MVAGRNHLQVLQAVVGLLPVDVVDCHAARDRAVGTFPDQPVLQRPLLARVFQHVARVVLPRFSDTAATTSIVARYESAGRGAIGFDRRDLLSAAALAVLESGLLDRLLAPRTGSFTKGVPICRRGFLHYVNVPIASECKQVDEQGIGSRCMGPAARQGVGGVDVRSRHVTDVELAID